MGIREQRKLLNISQVDLAKKIGVTQGLVSVWESGKYLPRAEKLPLIADALGCTVDDLLRRDE